MLPVPQDEIADAGAEDLDDSDLTDGASYIPRKENNLNEIPY